MILIRLLIIIRCVLFFYIKYRFIELTSTKIIYILNSYIQEAVETHRFVLHQQGRLIIPDLPP